MTAKPVGPYTPAVRAGDWLIVSGQVGLADGQLVAGGLEAQLRQALAQPPRPPRGERRVDGARGEDDGVPAAHERLRVMNEVYIEAFGDHRPARSAVAVAELPIGALVEVEAWAHLG